MSPEPIEAAYRDFMVTFAHEVNAMVKELFGPGMGFMFAMFPFEEHGRFSYISNGRREDMVKLLEEMTERFKQDQETRQ